MRCEGLDGKHEHKPSRHQRNDHNKAFLILWEDGLSLRNACRDAPKARQRIPEASVSEGH